MKKKTLISLLCAGVLTVGAFTGLTGFADKKDAEDACELYKEYKSDDKTTVKCSGKSLTIVTTDEDMLPDEDYTKEKVKEELEDQGFKCK